MHVTFGWHLDGAAADTPVSGVGRVTVGPQGLLSLLEGELGLPPVLEHATDQLVAYRACLHAADTPARFFHASFQIDPVGVASTLKSWRERWFEAGWQGQAPEGASVRIRDLAEVESIAAGRVPLCRGQRVQKVASALREGATQIRTLELVDPINYYPWAWQALLDLLPVADVRAHDQWAAAEADSDLGRLQEAFASNQPAKLSGDGTFLVVRSASRDLSATHVAELAQDTDAQRSIVLAERDGIIVDNALARSGLPRCGFQHYTRYRAIAQVLKLSLSQLWHPVEPRQLLQFLLHPEMPVAARVRFALADAVSQEPGIGGAAWRACIEQLREPLSEQEAVRFDEVIETWFHCERFDAEAGLPVDVASRRIRAVSGWLGGKLANAEDVTLVAGALAQAEALQRALEVLGRERINRIELERLVDENASDLPDAMLFAEAGHIRGATHPRMIGRPWSQVIWWDPHAESGARSDPWSAAEIETLRGAGVMISTARERLSNQADSWLLPLRYAQDRFVLVVHDDERAQHPFWLRLKSIAQGWREVVLEEQLLEGRQMAGVSLSPIDRRPLPEPRRWWQLPGTAFEPRAAESYSSMQHLFFAPHQWVLRYAARLRPGRAEDLADEARLYGSLAHRLFEQFFEANGDEWQTADVAGWAAAQLPWLIETEGAVLLESGRGVDRQQVRATLEFAMTTLVEHLKFLGSEQVTSEQQLHAPFTGDVRVRGSLDLLAIDGDGQATVIDAKYGGEPYRRREIEEGRHLQLATYAYLQQQNGSDGRWPALAYFIIRSGALLAAEAGSAEPLWSSALRTYAWRRAQLENGLVEVNSPLAEPTERSESPEGALNTQNESSNFDDFVHLLGWEPLA